MLITILTFIYFSFYAVKGERGFLRYVYLTDEVKEARRAAEKYAAEKSEWEAKVKLLSPESLDLDMLDEKQKHFMLECAKDYLQTGSLELSDNHIRIAPDSVFISDMVMSDLMKV